jgi:glycosyl-4,4'-diaponeurosporenoate acyltransferase
MTSSQIILLVVGNTLAWLVIHMGFAWAGTKAPPHWFNPQARLFRTYGFERSGRIYEILFRVKTWKDTVPDAAAWFKQGFPKKALAEAETAYLDRFIVETCRGEAVHWLVFLAAGLFFLWNSLWVGWVMVAYSTAANFPCIVIQRYNRARLRRLAEKRASRRVTS